MNTQRSNFEFWQDLNRAYEWYLMIQKKYIKGEDLDASDSASLSKHASLFSETSDDAETIPGGRDTILRILLMGDSGDAIWGLPIHDHCFYTHLKSEFNFVDCDPGIYNVLRAMGLTQSYLNNEKEMCASDYLLMINSVTSFKDLPSSRGIYMFGGSLWTSLTEDEDVSLSFKSVQMPLYIGKSENLNARFNSHHRIPEINLLMNHGWQITFYYYAENDFVKIPNIDYLEQEMIRFLRPTLNNSPVMANQSSLVNTQESTLTFN